MEFIQILGLVLGIAVLIVGAYKGFAALPLTLIASFVIMITNQMNVWTGFSQYYMGGYVGTYMMLFLLLASSSMYANFMDKSGSATAIGYKLIDWFGKKRVMLVTTLIVAVLTYGGVSLFVLMFVIVPVAYLLFKEANLPRHLLMAPMLAGSATFTMTSLPGTPALTNVIPTAFLGTTLTAAPVMGIIASVMLFVLAYLYMVYAEKKAVASGDGWSYPDNIDPTAYEASRDKGTLPPAIIAFLPMILLLLSLVIGSVLFPDAEAIMIACIGMLVGTLSCFLLNIERFKGKSKKDLVTRGLEGGITAISALAAVVAFGAVVSNSAGFQHIVVWLLGLNMNPYVHGVLATAVISGVTGSSSGGLQIMYGNEHLLAHFLANVPDLNVLHRLTAIAAGTLDTLPHAGGLFLAFSVLRLNHKSAYKHVFWASVAPAIIVTAIMLVATVLFIT